MPPVVGWRLGPAPARPRRPPQAAETAAPPARDSHVRIPPEGVGDVLHHPLHQHRHLLACLGHVGGGRGGSGAPPGERRAAGGSSVGERAHARARVRRFGRAPAPAAVAAAAAAEHFRVTPAAAGAWRPPPTRVEAAWLVPDFSLVAEVLSVREDAADSFAKLFEVAVLHILF